MTDHQFSSLLQLCYFMLAGMHILISFAFRKYEGLLLSKFKPSSSFLFVGVVFYFLGFLVPIQEWIKR